MTQPLQPIAAFILARLTDAMSGPIGAAERTEYQAMVEVTRKCASEVESAEPGWQVYDRTLRQYAARWPDHPDYNIAWAPLPEES